MSDTVRKHKSVAPKKLNFAVIICSSSRFKKLESLENINDFSGDYIISILQEHDHNIVLRKVLPDDESIIKRHIKEILDTSKADIIITCGGTGISQTDVTIESIQPLLEKELNGFGEIFRKLSYEKIGSAAILTRAIAGVSNGKAIFCIPGSPQAVSLCLEKLVLPEAGHIIKHCQEKRNI